MSRIHKNIAFAAVPRSFAPICSIREGAVSVDPVTYNKILAAATTPTEYSAVKR